VDRSLGLVSRVIAAGTKKFEEDDLTKLRRRREELVGGQEKAVAEEGMPALGSPTERISNG
jgi:hypothetical protein